MNIQERITYLKQFKYHLDVAKTCNQKYSWSEIKMFMDAGLYPPTPMYKDAMLAKKKVSISGHVKRKTVNKRLSRT